MSFVCQTPKRQMLSDSTAPPHLSRSRQRCSRLVLDEDEARPECSQAVRNLVAELEQEEES